MRGRSERNGDASATDAVTFRGLEHELTNEALTKRHLRDLSALLALPRMWRHRDGQFIVQSLVDVLVSLLRLDAAYVRLTCTTDASRFEHARPLDGFSAQQIGEFLGSGGEAGEAPSVAPNPLGTGDLRLLHVPGQLEDERAVVALGSRRETFPTDMDRFFAGVAIEQALIALRSSRLVAHLSHANAAKATFLATMSHELRTPLNAIIGYSDLLQAGVSGPLAVGQQQQVERIEAAARHLVELIDGILSFARLEAGKDKVHLVEVDPREAAQHAAALVAPLATAKGVALTVRDGGATRRLRTDPAKLRQILLNLLSNAVKFTERGEISIAIEQDETRAQWVVRDSGIGIAPDDIERIFEPFRQVEELRSARSPGTGLGLSVSRQLARLLGGDVTVQSQRGRGSTFTVWLPLEPGEETTAAAPTTP